MPKRIKRDHLGAYRVGGRTYVILDSETDRPDSPNGYTTTKQDRPDASPPDRHDKTDSGLAVVVARLEDEVRWLRGELERKHTIIVAMVQQRPALPEPEVSESGPAPRHWWAALRW